MNNINNKIIDFLTLKIMSDKDFECNPHMRVRAAWILAKKQFEEMNDEDKLEIVEQLDGFEKLRKIRDIDEKLMS